MNSKNFSKNMRLLSRSDFLYLKTDSKRYVNNLFCVYYKSTKYNSKNTRLGLGISKKYGNAVKRNELKRYIRESFRISDYRELGLDVLFTVNLKKIKSSICFSDVSLHVHDVLNHLKT